MMKKLILFLALLVSVPCFGQYPNHCPNDKDYLQWSTTSGQMVCFTPVFAQTISKASHQWLDSYDAATGLFTSSQPDFSDLSGIASVAQGGTGTATPSLVGGANVTITGTWPNQTVSSSGGSGGGGTVTSFSSGDLAPLFTTSVANSTTTPALSFTLSAAGAHSFLGNNTGTAAAPAYVQPALSDLNATFSAPLVLTGNTLSCPTCGGSGGSGTVTSVGLSLPSTFSVSGSPVTSSGNLTGSYSVAGADYLLTSTGPNAASFEQINGGSSCGDSSHALNYSNTTHTLGCQAIVGGSGIGGSGTVNTLPKFTATNTVGNSSLTDDGTALQLGETAHFAGPAPYFDVENDQYGAKPDGVTDDTAAIQSAIDAAEVNGGTVFFPPGKYVVSDPGLVVDDSNGKGIAFVGAGPCGGGPGSQAGSLCTSYIWFTGAGVALTIGSSSTFTYNGPIIADLGFHEANAGTSAGGVLEWNQSYSEVRHVLFEGFSKAGISAPSAPTVAAVAGGSLAASTTYFVAVSYTSPGNRETLASSASSATTSGTCPASGNCSISVTSPAASGDATQYNVYMGTSASALHLQRSAATAVGTNATVTSFSSSTTDPMSFSESGGYGIQFFGTMEWYGGNSDFVNQPLLTDVNTSGPANGIIADQRVSQLTMVGGNLNQKSNTQGCGIIAGGPSSLYTHAENGASGSKHYCLDGYDGFADIGMETNGPAGLAGVGMVKWDIRANCSAMSGTPVTLDSGSSGNTILMHSNGTCADPMVSGNVNANTIYEDSGTSKKALFSVPVNLSSAPLTPPSGQISLGLSGGNLSCLTSSGGNCLPGGGTTDTIASGTATLGTSAIASGACAGAVTVTAPGVLTTDVVSTSFNSDPTSVAGYGVNSSGEVLSIYPYPTSNNVNFRVCNSTGSSITPGALTLNWRVTR